MKKILFSIFLLFNLSPLHAEEVSSGYELEAKHARELLARAIQRYQEVGDKAFAEFSRQGEFVIGNLYVYVVSAEGHMLASGGPSAVLVGRDISPLLDDSLKQAFTEVLAEPKSAQVRSSEYRWLNWQDNRVERKRAYYRKLDDKIFAVGYYLPRSSPFEAQRLLDEAVTSMGADPVETIKRINRLDPFFNRDDLYVYVVNLDTEKFEAHGFQPRLIGTDFRSLSNASDKVGQKVLDAISGKEEAAVGYSWTNPMTRKLEHKQVLLRRSGNYLIAVGHYSSSQN